MNSLKYHVLVATLAVAPFAVANDNASNMVKTDTQRQAVQQLKDSIPGLQDLQVKNILTTNAGLNCITYETEAGNTEHAVVQGEEVQRSTLGNLDFQEAWNNKCVPASQNR
jgi:hypothetical protein